MTKAALQSQLATQIATLSPPYTAVGVQAAVAQAIHEGVASIVTFSATHNTQVLVAVPGGTARGITILEAFNGSGNPLSVVGTPLINRTVGGGNVGVTVQYAPPLGILKRRMSGTQTLTNGVPTTVTHDVTSISIGSSITLKSATQIQCNVAGIVQVTQAVQFDSALNGYRECAARHFNAASSQILPVPAHVVGPGGSFVYLIGEALVQVAVGDYFDQLAFQNSGGNIVLGGTNEEQSMTVQYVAPDPATVGTVRAIVWDS